MERWQVSVQTISFLAVLCVRHVSRAYVMLGRVVVRRVVLFVSYVLFVLCWSLPCSLALCSVVVCWAVACLSTLCCGVVVLCCVVLRCVG